MKFLLLTATKYCIKTNHITLTQNVIYAVAPVEVCVSVGVVAVVVKVVFNIPAVEVDAVDDPANTIQ